jgi:hypothetical protein
MRRFRVCHSFSDWVIGVREASMAGSGSENEPRPAAGLGEAGLVGAELGEDGHGRQSISGAVRGGEEASRSAADGGQAHRARARASPSP